MKSCNRILIVVLVLIAAFASQPTVDSAEAEDGWTTLEVGGVTARIYRDEWGIPHIFAPTNAALFEAYGYTVAQDRLWQLEVHRRAARGQLAEVFGPSFLEADQEVRRDGYTDAELDQVLTQVNEEERVIYTAYVNGINRYIKEVVRKDPSKMPYEFHFLGFSPGLWTLRDSAAFGAFMVRRFGEIGGSELKNQALLDELIARNGEAAGWAMFNDLRWVNDRDSPTTIPAPGSPQIVPGTTASTLPAGMQAQLRGAGAAVATDGLEKAKALWASLGIPTKLGSYAWAVRPIKSAEGAAMLYGGPQMGFDTPAVIHEVQLKGGSGFNVTGMAFAGVPPVLIGRNEDIAWTSTTATGDNVDTYVETLCGPTSYMFNGVCTPMEARQEIIKMRVSLPGVPLQTTDVVYDVYRTVHGPVIGFDHEKGVAFSQKRVHWMREFENTRPFLMFGRSHSPQQFEQAARLIVTAHNFMYADNEGNIAYWQTGLVPIRPAGYDARLPLPGTGEAEWPGGFRPMPVSINPVQAWLANWNNKPAVWFDDPDGQRFGKQNRVLEIQDRLAGSQLISLEDMFDIPKDIGRVEMTGRESRYLMPYLMRALDAVPSAHPLVPQARQALEQWDGSAISDVITSKQYQLGHVVFWVWQDKMKHATFGDEMGAAVKSVDSNVLLHALDGATSAVPPHFDYFNGADPNVVMVRSLEEALDSITFLFQTSDMSRWFVPREDTVFRHPLGIELGRIPLSNRSTYAQVVVLKKPTIEAYNIIPLGQSSFIAPDGTLGPHTTDQLDLFRLFQYKPMRLFMNLRLEE